MVIKSDLDRDAEALKHPFSGLDSFELSAPKVENFQSIVEEGLSDEEMGGCRYLSPKNRESL